MVTKFVFLQDFFGFSKNGQKKCPKLKTRNTFGKRKSFKYNKSLKQLKETLLAFSNKMIPLLDKFSIKQHVLSCIKNVLKKLNNTMKKNIYIYIK
jgi:hypothetical protein